MSDILSLVPTYHVFFFVFVSFASLLLRSLRLLLELLGDLLDREVSVATRGELFQAVVDKLILLLKAKREGGVSKLPHG